MWGDLHAETVPHCIRLPVAEVHQHPVTGAGMDARLQRVAGLMTRRGRVQPGGHAADQ